MLRQKESLNFCRKINEKPGKCSGGAKGNRMRVVEINTVNYGSTGKIALGIKKLCSANGIECRLAYRYKEGKNDAPDSFQVSSWLDCHAHNRIVRYTALQGYFSYFHTLAFLRRLSEYKPDVIHLHNLHGSYINLSLLFRYIKKHGIKVIWTLHDCWTFTGVCTYIDPNCCNLWKYECDGCPEAANYLLASKRSIAKRFKRKKRLFTGIRDLTVVTPSEWLAGLAENSFLKEYPVRVINNGINLDIFKPQKSCFREKFKCESKYIVLGVAFDWGERKGLDIITGLADRLDGEKYQIVLVGTNDETDKLLPGNIISIHRTQNQKELAEIYTAADVFINPTREDNFPTVNMESIACGTPVITFNTGGSPEMLDGSCGVVVPKNDADAMFDEIIRVCEKKPFSQQACLDKARSFDENEKFMEYIKLYREQ